MPDTDKELEHYMRPLRLVLPTEIVDKHKAKLKAWHHQSLEAAIQDVRKEDYAKTNPMTEEERDAYYRFKLAQLKSPGRPAQPAQESNGEDS